MIKPVTITIAAWAASASGVNAQSLNEVREQFRANWAKTECALLHPSYQPAYARCHEAATRIMWQMDRAFRMRSACRHPVFFTELTQIAYECSDAYKTLDGATGRDVALCFEKTFLRDFNPASVHYCAELKVVSQ